jgi:hypothetical protein
MEPEAIKGHERVGRERGSDVRSWCCRPDPLPSDRWVAIHYKRPGDDQWLPLETDAKGFWLVEGKDAESRIIGDSETLGALLGGEVNWSKHFIDEATGLDAYAPLCKTPCAETVAARVSSGGNLDSTSSVYQIPRSFLRKYDGSPQPSALSALMLPKKADPFADMLASFKAKPSRKLTTDMRWAEALASYANDFRLADIVAKAELLSGVLPNIDVK